MKFSRNNPSLDRNNNEITPNDNVQPNRIERIQRSNKNLQPEN
jgi:hypothetical protein